MSTFDTRHTLCAGEVKEFCPVTNREYERGSGALSKEEQTALFVRNAEIIADMARPGERCLQNGREYERGSGALPKSAQTARFLEELSPEEKALRQANFEALAAVEPAGKA